MQCPDSHAIKKEGLCRGSIPTTKGALTVARRELTLDEIDRMDNKDIEAWQDARRTELAQDAAKEREAQDKDAARREFLEAGGGEADFEEVYELQQSKRVAAAMEDAETR